VRRPVQHAPSPSPNLARLHYRRAKPRAHRTRSGVGIESLAGSDAGFVFRQAEAGVKETYPKGWVDEYTFSGKLARVVELVDTTYAVASAPIIRDTGTFTLSLRTPR
jgi:hypothetical protein